MENICKEKFEAEITRSGEIYIVSEDLVDVESLLGLNQEGGEEVGCMLVEKGVVDKYIIRGVDTELTIGQIAEELNLEGIKWKQVVRFTRVEDDKRTPISVVLIKEIGKRTKETVKVYYKNYRKERYIEKPKICKKCLRFGHFVRNCRGNQRCGKCGGDHELLVCTASEKKVY